MGDTGDRTQAPLKLRTLRKRRTTLRNRADEIGRTVATIDAATAGGRMQLTVAVGELRTALSRLSVLDDQIVGHPELNVGEDEEIDDAEDWAGRLDGFIQLGVARLNLTPREDVAPRPSTGADVQVDPFDGQSDNPSAYRVFRAQVDAWVRRHPDTTRLERLLHLLGKLRGPPGVLVSSLEITDQNFDVALRLLDDNYGGSDHERRRVLDRLSAIPVVSSAQDVIGLRSLCNHVQVTTLQLGALGVQPRDYALSLENDIRKSLPAQLLYEFDNDLRRDQRDLRGDVAGDRGVVGEALARLQQLTDRLQRYTKHLEECSRDPSRLQVPGSVDNPGLASTSPAISSTRPRVSPLRLGERSSSSPAPGRAAPGGCYQCGRDGHLRSGCPERRGQTTGWSGPPRVIGRVAGSVYPDDFSVIVDFPRGPVTALLDSGADVNVVSAQLAKEQGLSFDPAEESVALSDAQGAPLAVCGTVEVAVDGGVPSKFFVVRDLARPVILGRPYMERRFRLVERAGGESLPSAGDAGDQVCVVGAERPDSVLASAVLESGVEKKGRPGKKKQKGNKGQKNRKKGRGPRW